MASPRFIRKTDLAGLVAISVRETPVIESAEALRAFIAERAGPRAAELFAEPVVTWGNDVAAGSVSWYAPIAGEPVPITQLDSAVRAGPEALLRDRLRLIEPLLDDPQWGLALRNALVVPELSDVLSTGDDVVITNWGIAPQAIARDPRAKLDLLNACLGRYAPFGERLTRPTFFSELDRAGPVAAAPAPAQPARPARTIATPAAPPAAAPGAGGRGAAPPPVAPPPEPPRRGGGLVPIASFIIIFLVAVAGLGLGFWFGWNALLSELQNARRNAVNQQAIEDAIRNQRQINEDLRRRIAAARDLLSRDVCTIENPLGLPGAAEATPADRTATPAPQPQFQGSLVDLMDRAVVLVLTKRGDDLSIGSGFFVAPNLVLTNRHVAEQGQGGGIWVTNRFLGGARPAEIVAMTTDRQQFRPDFALLRIQGAENAPVLAITTQINRLDNVVAAGFPGIVVMTDQVFNRLVQGDATAIPETVVVPGEVSVVQSDQLSQRVLHTAPIAQGNSGGPLVDRCGRVLGVNTMLLADQQTLARVNYALGPETILTFLRANSVTPVTATTPCQAPQISITAPPLPAPPPATAQPAPQPAPGASPAAPAGPPAPTTPAPSAPAAPAAPPAPAPSATPAPAPAAPANPPAPARPTAPAATPPAATPPATTPPAAAPPAAPPAAAPPPAGAAPQAPARPAN